MVNLLQPEFQPVRKSTWRILAAALIIAAGACYVVGIESVEFTNAKATKRDFIEYWAIGQQLVHHANPYDLPAIVQLEKNAGLGKHQPRISFSPPTAFVLMLPLGLTSPKTGLIAWSLILIGCLSVAIWLLWRLNGRPASRIHLFGYLFAPAIACMMSGQLSIFLLLGVVVFLSFHRSHPLMAGAALLPCALKPHLFLVVACVLLVWSVYRRNFRVLFGFMTALLASCAVTLIFDVHVWRQYFAMMSELGVLQMFIPTFGDALRFLIDRNATVLQFVPLMLGTGWGLWYFWTRRDRWSWTSEGLLLLLVSDACAPYGAFTDECILLPLVLVGLYRAAESKRSSIPLMLANGAALIELFAHVNIISPYYLWSVPAWLAWYFYAGRKVERRSKYPVSQTESQIGPIHD
ncbi:MAG TPA: glycosyltransferase family 87 protein [Terracidiphilus sp.]|nr:glycosyltransferase family 87 protein [Terracidiphilus sp.]